MTIKHYVLNGGALFLDHAGIQSQVRACTVKCKETVKTTEPKPVLSGEQLETPDEVTYEWSLAVTVLQDITAAAEEAPAAISTGLLQWTWENAGDVVDFVFAPNGEGGTAAGVASGQVRVVPIDLGGNVKDTPETSFEWKIIGTPEFLGGF